MRVLDVLGALKMPSPFCSTGFLKGSSCTQGPHAINISGQRASWLICHYSGSSFGAAERNSWGRKQCADNPLCQFLLVWLVRQGFCIPFHWCLPHLVPVILTLFMGQRTPGPKPMSTLKGPAGGSGEKKGEDKKHPSKRRVPKPGIDQALCVKEKHYKQERRNKSGKFISALPKRSECDKRPPVVRRSVAGQPLSKHSLGDGRGIRHGSDCGETQPGWKQKAPSRLPGHYLKNNCLVKFFH